MLVVALGKYLQFAERAGTLFLTFLVSVMLLFLVFPALPIEGELLDVQSWYTHTEAMALLDGYGSDGRTIYLWSSLLLDTLFPVVYVTFLAGLIHRCRVTDSTWWLALAPVIGGIVDLAENVQISLMLATYPEISEIQVLCASIFTTTKHWVFYASLAMALILLLVSSIRAISKALDKVVE